MKKFITGIVVGALLFGAIPAFANSVKSLIGTKVTGIYAVEQDGKKLTDGVVLNGSAYVPVRVIAEATGTGLTVEGKTIILEGKSKLPQQPIINNTKRDELIEDLKSREVHTARYKEVIKQTEDEIAETQDKTKIEGLEAYKKDIQERLLSVEKEILKIKTELGE
ncbi:hypothetical protein J2Z32_002139 [Paenibacillus turicensis]|uniref:Copper amine oxidase-like N-terminal domain-containing protein n=1 Tax=Paenibacillus turicensis TaxID=160487 RepID=A0ABS4FSF1_9BACL|nr:hypothetical protein [Paenibacillus turicensis]MBP1905509.1 hypothetical protein [Paenibacillus turicensis]